MLHKNDIEQKLQELTGGESNWRERAEERRAKKSWLKLSARIAFRVLDELKHQGITQVELAERLGVSPQAVNKWLKGKENFTLESVFKLEQALGTTLITVPKLTGTPIERSAFNADQITYGSSHTGIEVKQPYISTRLKLVMSPEAA